MAETLINHKQLWYLLQDFYAVTGVILISN